MADGKKETKKEVLRGKWEDNEKDMIHDRPCQFFNATRLLIQNYIKNP